MATSRVDATIARLVAIWDAEAALSDAVVNDGPVKPPFDAYPELVMVGHDGEEESTAGAGAQSSQDFVGIGTNSRRDEQIDITCAVICNRPDEGLKDCRARAYELYDACEAAVLADHTLGVGTAGTPGALRNAVVSQATLFQSNNADGVRARLVFTVSGIARL